MGSLFDDAVRAVRSGTQEPLWRLLGGSHGAAGAILGALIDVFAVGGRRSIRDVSRAQEVAKVSGLSYGIEEVPISEPVLAPGPRGGGQPQALPRVLRTEALQEQYRPAWVQRGGIWRLDTIPDTSVDYSPPTPSFDAPVPGQPPTIPSRSVADDATYTGPRPTVRGVRKVMTPDEAREARRRGRPEGYNDYRLGAMQVAEEGKPDVFASEIETPQSSNVFSFAYDEDRGILYVTFKAPSEPVGYVTGINSCSGEEYRYAVRAHERGPMYAYGSAARPIPKAMYDELVSAPSKGKWVWNRLRVCGSYFQHQVPYTLVSPSMSGILYVPRKATSKGWRVRSVPTVGKGMRPVEFSTRPEQLRR